MADEREVSALHFSDLHGNSRALESVKRVCRDHPEAAVLATGDLSRDDDNEAPSEFETLSNPLVVVIPGDHDIRKCPGFFKSYARTRWKSPSLLLWENIAVVSISGDLSTAEEGAIVTDIRSDLASDRFEHVVFLVHELPCQLTDQMELIKADTAVHRQWICLLGFLQNTIQSASVSVLHGHGHARGSRSPRRQTVPLLGRPVTFSYVYSAWPSFLGLGHLLQFGREGVRISIAYDRTLIFGDGTRSWWKSPFPVDGVVDIERGLVEYLAEQDRREKERGYWPRYPRPRL